MKKKINIPIEICYDGKFCNDENNMCDGRFNEPCYKSLTNCNIFKDELVIDEKRRVLRCKDCLKYTS